MEKGSLYIRLHAYKFLHYTSAPRLRRYSIQKCSAIFPLSSLAVIFIRPSRQDGLSISSNLQRSYSVGLKNSIFIIFSLQPSVFSTTLKVLYSCSKFPFSLVAFKLLRRSSTLWIFALLLVSE